MTPDDSHALSEHLKGLGPAQRALLERRLIERRVQAAREHAIPKRAARSPVPLSYSQELLWLLDRMAPGGAAYNSPSAFRLEGTVDEGVLSAAIEELSQRHEILRTTYALIDGRPMQVVSDRISANMRTVDLRRLGDGQREAELRRLCGEEGDRPFDLQDGPLMRTTLFMLGPAEAVVLFVFHHIAVDGWSKGLLFGELSAIYDAFAEGRPVPLPAVELQYADYAVWHRNWLEGGVLDHQLAYWREHLRGMPAALELPTDHARPPVQSFRGERIARVFERPLLDGLIALSRREGATLFMALLAALSAVLSRHSGQDDVVIGTPFLSRNRAELERVVGYFTNTVALRMDLAGDPTFRELLRRARDTTLGAFAHGDVPYEVIVKEVNPQRDLSRSPVFQVMIGLRNEYNPLWGEGRPSFAPSGVETSGVILTRTWAKFDLGVGMGELPEGLSTGWEYSTDLFEGATIERLICHFEHLVKSALEDPDRRLSALSLLGADEHRQLVVDWNETDRRVPSGRLDQLVEAQSRRTPEAVAVECDGRRLTYAELDDRANRLAHRLRSVGVPEGAHVAIAADRSFELVVGLLGILKAGGACVPVDVDYPRDRIQYMLEDSGARVLLTREALADGLPQLDIEVLRLDADWPVVRAESGSPSHAQSPAEDIAYVVYTSGSTGRPRGVLLTHRGLVNHAAAAVDLYRLSEQDRVLQFASISFDISIEEIFPTLASGGTLVLRTQDTPLAGSAFVEWIADSRLTVLDLPTAFWHAWVNGLAELGLEIPDCVRLVVVGGEKASADVYDRWLGVGGDRVTLVNTYGPTETSVISTSFELGSGGTDDPPGEIPLGRPIANTKVYVLDANRQPAPLGVPGELYIGGAGVARGYHGLPELTRERFVTDLFGGNRPERAFRTGDIVRWRTDGNLMFVGRIDDQVKIRGFRVEPGEVEAALERHPAIGAAVVVGYEPRPGDKSLAAYVECSGNAPEPAPIELRRFLADRLPEYMIPSSIVVLGELPLTPNGKVDRDGLPAPTAGTASRAEVVEPRDELEASLAAIWRRVIHLQGPVSVCDDFFAVGGHSLLAVRLVAEIEREFRISVPLNSLFQGATIEDLAARVRSEVGSPEEWSPLVPLRPSGEGRPLFLLHGPGGDLLYYRALVRHLDPGRPVYGLQPIGLDGSRTLRGSLDEMAADYVGELLRFQPEGSYLLCGYCFAGVVAYEVARQLEEQGRETALLAVIDATPFGLYRPTRLELERQKFADFLQRDARGKAEWIATRSRGLLTKLSKRTRWALYDLYVRVAKSPGPRRLQTIREAHGRARGRYVTKDSSCRLTLFRAETGDADDTFPDAWTRLARGGVEVHVIESEGIRHDNIMSEPHARAIAAALDQCIATALGDEGGPDSRTEPPRADPTQRE